MGYKVAKIDYDTTDLLDSCIKEFLRHHPEMEKVKISRNKIISEIAQYYLK